MLLERESVPRPKSPFTWKWSTQRLTPQCPIQNENYLMCYAFRKRVSSTAKEPLEMEMVETELNSIVSSPKRKLLDVIEKDGRHSTGTARGLLDKGENGRVSGTEQRQPTRSWRPKLSKIQRGHQMDGWRLRSRLCAHPEISPESNSVQTQKSSSNETINRGPPRVYARTEKDHIHTLKIL